jgi:hypothetical protein
LSGKFIVFRYLTEDRISLMRWIKYNAHVCADFSFCTVFLNSSINYARKRTTQILVCTLFDTRTFDLPMHCLRCKMLGKYMCHMICRWAHKLIQCFVLGLSRKIRVITEQAATKFQKKKMPRHNSTHSKTLQRSVRLCHD